MNLSDSRRLAELYARKPGVYRLDEPLLELQSRLVDAGWRTVTLASPKDKTEVLAALARELDFPDYFGRNLDALWDCLTDLGEPTAVVWNDWGSLLLQAPDDWAALLELLEARTEEEPDFALVLV